MEGMEYIIYALLFLVLMAFIGIIGYIIYDNYTYKNNLTSDLNTNFIDINQNFNSTSNIISRLHQKHTSNYQVLDNKIDVNSNAFVGRMADSSNVFDRRLFDTQNQFNQRITDVNARNTISSNLFTNNIDTFGYNMNKYFTFNNENNTNAFNETNKKIFEYRTTGTDPVSQLDLITKTTATAGLKVSSDGTTGLEVCNKTGTNCFNMYGNDNDLYIYGKNDNQMNRNIYIGSNDKNAPIRIENGIVKLNDVDVSTIRTDVSSIRTDVNTLAAKSKAVADANYAVTVATIAESKALAIQASAGIEVSRTTGIVTTAGTAVTPAQTKAKTDADTAKAVADAEVIKTTGVKTAALKAKAVAEANYAVTVATIAAIDALAIQASAVKEVIRTTGIVASAGATVTPAQTKAKTDADTAKAVADAEVARTVKAKSDAEIAAVDAAK